MRMNRRMFIRVVGGVGLTSAVPFRYVLGAEGAAPAASGILVEAASFAEQGGWKLDTQHYQQMGGCYLLAHGMGKPVAKARTTVRIPQPGTWHVWVRTRDWCTGGLILQQTAGGIEEKDMHHCLPEAPGFIPAGASPSACQQR